MGIALEFMLACFSTKIKIRKSWAVFNSASEKLEMCPACQQVGSYETEILLLHVLPRSIVRRGNTAPALASLRCNFVTL
jgi:hypothetical protein